MGGTCDVLISYIDMQTCHEGSEPHECMVVKVCVAAATIFTLRKLIATLKFIKDL